MTAKRFDAAAARQAFETALREHEPDFEVFFLSRLYGLEFSYPGDTCMIQFPVHDFMFNPQGSLHGGVAAFVLDVGANADVKPTYLVQFAQMGSIYAEHMMGVQRPRVALLNIGGEDTKGSELMQDVHARLRAHPEINFVGNIEGGDTHRDRADVIVTDGFTGNVAVKVVEGTADFIFRELRTALTSKLQYRLAALVLRSGLRPMRDRMDPGTYGGVPLLGVNGVV